MPSAKKHKSIIIIKKIFIIFTFVTLSEIICKAAIFSFQKIFTYQFYSFQKKKISFISIFVLINDIVFINYFSVFKKLFLVSMSFRFRLIFISAFIKFIFLFCIHIFVSQEIKLKRTIEHKIIIMNWWYIYSTIKLR